MIHTCVQRCRGDRRGARLANCHTQPSRRWHSAFSRSCTLISASCARLRTRSSRTRKRCTASPSQRKVRHLIWPFLRFDPHDFRASSVIEFNPVAHVRGQQRLADWRNPTDAVPFKIEFVDADNRKRFSRAFLILDCYRCAKRDAVRWPVRRINNVARCQNLP